jgi:isoleucyl-tRNA synthetase
MNVVSQAKKPAEAPYTVLKKYTGAELVGSEYTPMFDYFAPLKQEHKAMFTIISDTYVTDDTGTGIVHNAPGFGEDDYRVCVAHGVVSKDQEVPCPIDADGCFTDEVIDFKGVYVKAADNAIVKKIRGLGRMVVENVLMHKYPHCWRSDTPLLYRAIPAWFVDVPKVKERLVKNNEDTYWVPSHIKTNRFHNWLADAREWCVSRNRFWGTPIPIWTSEDGSEVVVIGSIEVCVCV